MMADLIGPSSSSWPHLLPELLVQVLLRLPSHADRVRFRAVCRSWRSAVQRRDLPPLLPWVALRDGAFLSLPDGVLYRLPLPSHVSHRVSMGDTLFSVHRDATCSLTNPLTGEMASEHIDPDILWSDMRMRTHNVRKVVVSDRVVAAIGISGLKASICSRAPQTCSTCFQCELPADDIVLFQGKLYLLTSQHFPIPLQLHRKLHAMDLGQAIANNTHHVPVLQCVIPGTADIPGAPINTSPTDLYKRHYYLVVSGDRLLMVEGEVEMEPFGNVPRRTRRLEVFEATGLLDGSGHARWRKVDTLMGHALFISLDCSWSIPVANHYGRAVGGAREDCVYFLNEHKLHSSTDGKPGDDFRNCGVYNIRDQTLSPLPTELASTLASHGGPWSLTWFFLPHI
ncbi:hypothetical protein ACQ4PT_032484 [Festuca glaucescens]